MGGKKQAANFKTVRSNYNDLCTVGWEETAILYDFQEEDYALRNTAQWRYTKVPLKRRWSMTGTELFGKDIRLKKPNQCLFSKLIGVTWQTFFFKWYKRI